MNGKDKFGNVGSEQSGMNSSRARNRTVMLTPEMTGQVRALLHSPEEGLDSILDKEIEPPKKVDFDKGFSSPTKAKTQENLFNSIIESSSTPPEVTGHFGGRSGTLTDLSRLIDSPASTDSVKQSINNLLSLGRDSGLETPTKSQTENKYEERSTGFHARPKIFEEKSIPVTQVTPPEIVKSKVSNASSRIIGFLISFDRSDNGEIFEIREGRYHISSKVSDQNDLIYIDDNSISALHAVIKASGNGDVLILDQLSENGSTVMHQGSGEEEDASGKTVKIFHGDVVRLGRRYFIYCGVPRLDIRG